MPTQPAYRKTETKRQIYDRLKREEEARGAVARSVGTRWDAALSRLSGATVYESSADLAGHVKRLKAKKRQSREKWAKRMETPPVTSMSKKAQRASQRLKAKAARKASRRAERASAAGAKAAAKGGGEGRGGSGGKVSGARGLPRAGKAARK